MKVTSGNISVEFDEDEQELAVSVIKTLLNGYAGKQDQMVPRRRLRARTPAPAMDKLQQSVYDKMVELQSETGHLHTSKLMTSLGLSYSRNKTEYGQVTSALQSLKRQKLVANTSHGIWRVLP